MSLAHKTEGIILRHSDVGETDKLVTLFTKDFGKISVIARGVRLPKSKLGCHLKLGARLRLMLAENGERLTLTDAEEYGNVFSESGNGRGMFVGKILAVLDRMIQGQEQDREIWDMMTVFFDFIGECPESASENALEKVFGLRLLRHLGYVGNETKTVNAVLAADWNSCLGFSEIILAEIDRAYCDGLRASSL